jgi:hypothetical protein
MRRRKFIKLLAGTAVALPVAVRSQQPSIWTIESFNISREPCVDLHVDVCSERCDSARAPARVVYRGNH